MAIYGEGVFCRSECPVCRRLWEIDVADHFAPVGQMGRSFGSEFCPGVPVRREFVAVDSLLAAAREAFAPCPDLVEKMVDAVRGA